MNLGSTNTPVAAQSLDLPNGYSPAFEEDSGDLVINDTNGNTVFRWDDTNGQFQLAAPLDAGGNDVTNVGALSTEEVESTGDSGSGVNWVDIRGPSRSMDYFNSTRFLWNEGEGWDSNASGSGAIDNINQHPDVKTGSSAGKISARWCDRTPRYWGDGVSGDWTIEIFSASVSNAGDVYVGTWTNGEAWDDNRSIIAVKYDTAADETYFVWNNNTVGGEQSVKIQDTINYQNRIRIDWSSNHRLASVYGNNNEALAEDIDVSTNTPTTSSWYRWHSVAIDDPNGGGARIIPTAGTIGYVR
jgi:uncharacterized protein YuzE